MAAAITYRGVISSAADATFYNALAGTSLGAGEEGRLILVVAHSRATTGAVIDEITINGQTATILARSENASSVGNCCVIAGILDESATVADVDIRFTSQQLRCIAQVYTATGATLTGFVADAKSTGVGNDTPRTFNLSGLGNGALLLGAAVGNNAVSTTWGTATEDNSTQLESLTASSASDSITDGSTSYAATYDTSGTSDVAAAAVWFPATAVTPTGARVVTDINGDIVTDANGRPVTSGVSYDDVVAGATAAYAMPGQIDTPEDFLGGNDGEWNGAAAYADGVFGRAYSFDGSTKRVQIPSLVAGNLGSTYTFLARATAGQQTSNTGSGIRAIAVVGNAGDFFGVFGFRQGSGSEGDLLGGFAGVANEQIAGGLPAGVATPVASSYDGTDLTVRSGATKQSAAVSGSIAAAEPVQIGAHGSSAARGFVGSVSEFLVILGGLTDASFAAYSAGPPPTVTASTLTFAGSTANFAATITDPNNGAVTVTNLLQDADTNETIYEGTATSFDMPNGSAGSYRLWVIAENNGGVGVPVVSSTIGYAGVPATPSLPASVKAYWNPSLMTSLGARVIDQSQNGNDLDYGAVLPTLETDSDGRKYLAFTQATTDFLTAQDFFDLATQDFAMIAVTRLKARSTTNVGQIMGTTNARRVMRWSGDSNVALQEIEVGAALNGEIYAGSDIKQVTTVSHVSDLQRCRNFSVESSWGEPGRATAEQVADDVQATDADPSNPTGDLVINEAEHGLDFYGAIYLENPTEQDIQDAVGWAMNQWALPGTVSDPAIVYQGDSTVHVGNAFTDRTPGWNRVLHQTYLPATVFGQNHANGGRRITRSAPIGAMDADDDRVYDTAIQHLVWSGRTVYWALMIGTNDAADGESATNIISEIEIEAARVAALGATPVWLGCCPDHQGDGPTGVRTLVSEGVRDNTNTFTQTIDALENDDVWGWGNEANTTGPTLMADNTHPNTAGNADIALNFSAAFLSLVGAAVSLPGDASLSVDISIGLGLSSLDDPGVDEAIGGSIDENLTPIVYKNHAGLR